VDRAVQQAVRRSQRRPLTWYSDGWQGYRAILVRAYRQPIYTGRRGRPRLTVPETLCLTQSVKHRDARGHLLAVEIVAALGKQAATPGTVHIERVNGSLRDRINALTRKTHAFAKRDATWDALVTLALFEHNWLRPHRALRRPLSSPLPQHARYHQSSPAMALGLTDHIWSWSAFLTTPI
jgi:hypothetical protein